VRAIRTEISSLSAQANTLSLGGSALLVPVLFLLVLWFAVPAVAALWAGIALLRISSGA
jgi:hypothetical protein